MQKYKWHRLLAYDPNNDCNGVFMDWWDFAGNWRVFVIQIIISPLPLGSCSLPAAPAAASRTPCCRRDSQREKQLYKILKRT